MAGVQTTTQQRRNYAPACKPKGSLFIPAYQARDFIFKRHQYRCNKSYTGCYSCRPITGGTEDSLHAFGPGDRFVHWDGTPCGATALAEDVNAAQNPYGPRLVTDRTEAMQREIDAIRTKSGAKVWGWGGYYRNNKDAMHDEIVCTLQDLMSGIDWSTVAGWEDSEEEDMPQAWIIKGHVGPEWWVCTAINKRYIDHPEHAKLLHTAGMAVGSNPEGHPFVWGQHEIDRIPTLVTEQWLWKLTLDSVARDKATKDEIIKAVVDANSIGFFSDAQLEKVIEAVTKELEDVKGLDPETQKKLKSLTPEAIAKAVVEEIASQEDK